ncbi:hypothetical protein [Sphingomonas psychrolutea]|nr:hypothetical protein [Sphingomonas psychrolutea]
MAASVVASCGLRGWQTVDATGSTGAKDYLERIIGLIRGTAFTIAIFSHETRPSALANIALELGFAAMFGKPLMIVKSKEAVAPSDLKRTDWIEFSEGEEGGFEDQIRAALDQLGNIADYQGLLLDMSLEAPEMDCAVALERAIKAFLLSGEARLLDKAEQIRNRLQPLQNQPQVDDLKRLHRETSTFIRQGRQTLV